MQNNYRVKGAFFENMKPTGPAFTGFVEIDNVRTEIALWPKTSQKGVNYFQVSEDKKKPAQQSGAPGPRRGSGSFGPGQNFAPRSQPPQAQYTKPTSGPQHHQPINDMDDDIPF